MVKDRDRGSGWPRGRRWRAVVALWAVLAVGGLLAGCGAPPASPGAYAFVVGVRANQVAASTAAPALQDQIRQAVASRATVTVLTAEGVPQVVGALRLANTGPNANLAGRQDRRNAATVSRLVAAARARVGEANPLAALDVAGRAVADTAGRKVVVVVDSGLSTTAPLRFQDGLLRAEPGRLVGQLKAGGSLPRLAGVSVVWIGLAETANPQPPVTIAARARLQQLWEAIIIAGGGRVTFAGTPLPATAPVAGLPAVAVVEMPADAPATLPPPLAVALGQRQVSFVDDSAELKEPAAARAVLADLAAQIVQGGYRNVEITGTTAGAGTEEGRLRLSRARAGVVRDLLVREYGVPAEVITAVRGVGTHFPGYVPDRAPDGGLDESRAELNRLVIITASR